tara:strand:+ start:1705 stop:2613 length:909 start_codon:yes stop_codon:yes gene_type:complete
MDSEDIDIRFGSNPHPTPRDNAVNWTRGAELNSQEALYTAGRFYGELDKSNLSVSQAEILRQSIIMGTYRASCEITSLRTGANMHAFQSLEYIEPDEGNREEKILLKAFKDGLITRSGLINDPSRQFLNAPLFTHINRLLEDHDEKQILEETSLFTELTNGIIELWQEVMEGEDFDNIVCYKGHRYTIESLFERFDNEVQKTEEHGVGPYYTFREFWTQHHDQMGISAQDTINIWDQWSPIQGGIHNPHELGLLPLQPDEMVQEPRSDPMEGGMRHRQRQRRRSEGPLSISERQRLKSLYDL